MQFFFMGRNSRIFLDEMSDGNFQSESSFLLAMFENNVDDAFFIYLKKYLKLKFFLSKLC